MGSREIMEDHKIIFRAIAQEVDIVAEADLREMSQVITSTSTSTVRFLYSDPLMLCIF